jgi:hypothetical protein
MWVALTFQRFIGDVSILPSWKNTLVDPPNGLHGDPSALFALQNSGAAEKLKNPKERYSLSAQVFSIGIQHATVAAKPYTPAF